MLRSSNFFFSVIKNINLIVSCKLYLSLILLSYSLDHFLLVPIYSTKYKRNASSNYGPLVYWKVEESRFKVFGRVLLFLTSVHSLRDTEASWHLLSICVPAAIIKALYSSHHLISQQPRKGCALIPRFVEEKDLRLRTVTTLVKTWLETRDPNPDLKSHFFLPILLLLPLSQPSGDRNNYIYLLLDEWW